jgi:hypothetical protein
MMTTAKSATGVEGCLIRGIDGEYYFRVYDADHNFVDYDLMHSDLSITVTDPDAFFYNDEFTARLDHSPATLGLE